MMYYFANGMEQRGPYSLEEMAQFGLRPDTLVWREGMANWQRMDSVAELMALVPKATIAEPPSAQPATVAPNETTDLQPLPASASAATVPPWNSPQPMAGSGPTDYSLQYQSGVQVAPASGMAIASLVLGIVSLLSMCLFHVGALLGLPSAILAIVFGVLAKPKIASGEMSGRGMSLAGIICGSIYLALVVIVVIIVLVAIAFSMK